jgi:hypothetical protein
VLRSFIQDIYRYIQAIYFRMPGKVGNTYDIATRAQVVALKEVGMPIQEISDYVGVSIR